MTPQRRSARSLAMPPAGPASTYGISTGLRLLPVTPRSVQSPYSPVEQSITLLHDPSPAVIRDATAALRPLTRAVSDQVAWDLLADPRRVELRRAGYRLLRVRGLPQQLRAALLLANDSDARLARRAIADATRLARDAASPSWRRLTLPALDASPDQIVELADLTDRAAEVLGEDTTRMLHAWLVKTREQL